MIEEQIYTDDRNSLQVVLHIAKAMNTLEDNDVLGTSSDDRVLALTQIGVLCRIATALEKIERKMGR
jgi:hypothetical protein